MDNDEQVVWLRDLDGTGSMHPAAKGDPGAVMYVPASALRSSGEAVATVCLVGERYAHGNMVEVQLQLASADSPAPKIGDRYYLHPATPASAWRPIAEAPRDGTRVLLHVEGVDRPVLGQWDGSEWVTLDANDWSGRNLLSWSALPPLPTPPTSTGATP